MALPSGYTELTYIQSSGTQYIDTGFQPNYNTRVVIDCEPTETASAQRAIFGARNSTSGQASLAFGFNIMNSTSCRSDYMGSNATISGTYTSGTRMSVDMNKNVCTVNGKTGTNTAKTSGQTPYNLFIFNVNNVGTPHSSFGFKGKIYSCKIYDNGTLVRDFVPCRNSSGTVGLYDVVNSKFYANAGTGVFTYPGYITPVEGHNAVISGTAYEITGGKVRVNGTVYEIAKGKTLVNGTAYEIAFGGIKVEITGTGNRDYCYVTIAGVKYYTATTLTIDSGTSITTTASAGTPNIGVLSNCLIYLNNVAVVQNSSTGAVYTFTPDCKLVRIQLGFTSTSEYSVIRIFTS